MPTHDDKDPEHSIWQQPEDHAPEEIDASAGYEKSDVKTRGILVFLTALAIFVVVTAVLCYGIGMVLNAHMRKEDGPRSKWAKTVDVTTLGNMASSPELQNKMATMTQQFPTPRLQTDDGSQEIADLHAKRGSAAGELQLGRPAAGQGENSHRAGDGVDCAERIAGGPDSGSSAVADRGREAGGGRAADEWVCAYRI